jgi:serine/threonine protein kinase
LGYAVEGKERCLVTPFFAQGSLQKALPRHNRHQQLRFSALERVGACLDVAQGLHFLHTQSPPVWHLDLKPDNVVRAAAQDGGHWKLIDFGLARRVNNLRTNKTYISTTTVAGTWGFIAPELQEGKVSAACDVFSFGVLLLATLTGLSPTDIDRRVRETLEDLAERAEDSSCAPADLICTSALTAESCDWTFSHGPALLLQLLQIGLRCCRSKDARLKLPDVITKLQRAMTRVQTEVRECLVCLDAPRTTVLEPCRHAVACANCAEILRTSSMPCPVCREPIQAVVTSGPALQTFVQRS